MSLRHGARQFLTATEADEAEAQRLLDIAVNRIKYNPDYAVEQIRKAQDLIRKAARRRDEELPQMLQKAAPPLEKMVKDLEARVNRLEGNTKVVSIVRRRARR